MFGRMGYSAATIRGICRQAGVNVAAINYHFGGKAQRYRTVVMELIARTFDTYRTGLDSARQAATAARSQRNAAEQRLSLRFEGSRQERIDQARAALAQAREHWRITNLLYRQQLTTSTEVLDARSYLDRAQSAYHEAHYGYVAARAGLAWAMGSKK